MVALGLGLVDALWNLTLRRWGQVALRVLVAVLVGAVGGLIGGMLGQWLLDRNEFLFIFGWTLTGLLVGTSIGVYEILAGLMRQENVTGARKKLIKCLVGGAVGGLLGGLLALFLRNAWHKAFGDKDPDWLWSPTAWGFVALGMCIGLLVGLAQVILKEAWIKVEAGFRPGREMILSKEKTTIGRAEACDLGLFGDPTIEKLHASIIQSSNRYFVEDAGTPGGTYLNDRPVGGRVGLNSGDLIRVGRSVLRFNERQKRNS
jgi:MFS family permease